ncbi:hypothetical protein [Ignatzschineria cameli]|uniref:Uncharacterized protein n=2 Tax=Ignatzschineria cameli TaxID=2182793 RepID=A0A2U2AL66_9GAMM|nr:hypothetical protein [Ignatzschineria cameli]PWD83949.1 hypothetical protein DC077_08765 [Ignatzschineria cameli]PWD87662.1 hypothetical protein DC079_10315 [Ignatzschineria cameli]PWD88596.1 hypothetical protein DC081_10460 [Ignatzschineria cameli]PWD88934.1 hypothetical protein DC078_10455 [Ignatzschineria cameli]
MLPEITYRQMVIFYHQLFFDIKKAVELPDLTIAYFHGPRAGKGASSMPNGGHAIVKRTRWLAPASQKTFLRIIDQN